MVSHAHLGVFCIWGKLMGEKGFKTIDEQIKLLRSRGLTITDETTAKAFLIEKIEELKRP